MDLGSNEHASFTRWVVRAGALREPFVLIDVGVHGGIQARWRALGDRLVVYGFDPLVEALAPLQARAKSGESYFSFALGSRDGECELTVPRIPTETSLYRSADAGERRRVPVRKLDTLFAEHAISTADFIKIDVEGAEPDVLRGAADYLQACDLIGAELETNFGISPTLTDSHFAASYTPLLHQRLVAADLAFDRTPRGPLATATSAFRNALTLQARHSPATYNVLFARDFVHERRDPQSYAFRPAEASPSVDQIIKAMIVFELYGLIDRAYELLTEFRQTLSSRFDIEEAGLKLVPGIPAILSGIVRRNWRRITRRPVYL